MYDPRVFIGISDRCLHRGRIRWVGFHDYDGFLSRSVSDVFQSLELSGILLSSGAGWHFVTLEILDLPERAEFARVFTAAFPSDYRFLRDNCLRLSAKRGERPTFALWMEPRKTPKVSSYHLYHYRRILGESHYKDIRRRVQPVKTYGHLYQYSGDIAGVGELVH